MKPFIFTLLLGGALIAHAQPNHLVISQVYVGGGNTGAYYNHDFVELYNPTSSIVSLTGWSVQYAGATGTTWSNSNKANLSGSIAPGKYFLVQLDGGTEGGPLPQPDLVISNVNVNLSGSGGKLALVNSTTLLTGSCPSGGTVVDFVAYKSTSTPNCSETAPVVTPTNYSGSISRKTNGCTDTDNNSTDFETTIPSPRNSRSNGHSCIGGSITVGAVTPNPFCVDAGTGAAGTVNFTTTGTFNNSVLNAILSDAIGSFGTSTVIGSATVSGTNPSGTISIVVPANTASGTGYKIKIESSNPLLTSLNQSAPVEVINGAKNLLSNEFWSAANNGTLTLNWVNPTGCFDEILIVAKEGSSINGTPSGDGSTYTADLNFSGNGTPFDGGKVVYKGTASGQTITNLTNGTTYYLKAFTRRGSQWSSGTEISDKPRVVPLPGEILINQLSAGYNGSTDEYFELVNVTEKPFDLSDVAIRVLNGSGVTVVAGGSLSGIIQPHSFWLVSPNASITVGQTDALVRDNAVDGGFAATSNQIALIRKTDNTILDAVGYGNISTRTYTEGSPTANPPSKGGLKRKVSGADNNNNSADFTSVANADIDLRNSNSRLANAGAIINGGNYMQLEVTGNATLGGDAVLSSKTVFTNGVFSLGNFNLTTTEVAGATEQQFIRTPGSGSLSIRNITNEAFFPIGNSTLNPVTIAGGSGMNWSASVTDGIVPTQTPFDKEAAVQRTWRVLPATTPATDATVVLEYNDNDRQQLGSRFDKKQQVLVWQYQNGAWKPASGPQTPVLTASGRKAVSISNSTGAASFAITNINAALPVHFTGFTARRQSGGVQLQFTNASEKDVAYYALERAADGQHFQTLIQLSPKENDGSMVTYTWLDAAPLSGTAWYRVKGVDNDGTTRFTPTLKLSLLREGEPLTVYPNPVQGRTVLWQANLPAGVYTVQVRSSNGRQVMQEQVALDGGTHTQTLRLPAHLGAGVYYLQVGRAGVTQRRAFVVH